MSWVDDMDALASANVIAFDAPAYIKGTKPRYYGNPPLETMPDFNVKLPSQVNKDEFNGTKNKKKSTLKTVFGVALAGTAIFLCAKNFSKITTYFKEFDFKKLNPKNIKFKKINLDGIKNNIKTVLESITSVFKRKTT